MTEDTMALIAQLEDRRYEAMLRGDVATLDHLLDDRLRYVHSNGSADGKASYLDGFRKGVWSYRSIAREDQTIVPFGEAAAVFNILRIDIDIAGVQRKVHARALALWIRSEQSWRLAALSSASIVTP